MFLHLLALLGCSRGTPPSAAGAEVIYLAGVRDPVLVQAIEDWTAERPVDTEVLWARSLDAHDGRTRERLAELVEQRRLEQRCQGCYAAAILRYTDRSWTPEALHALGEQALAKAEAELEPGTLDTLRAAPLLSDEQALQQAVIWLAKFSTPLAPCHVEAITEQRFTGGYRRGTVALQMPLQAHALPSLLAHECVPGHHLHAAASARERGWPLFLQQHTSAAVEEGWAFYAESLLADQGLYDELALQSWRAARAWRAARVVVDTGVHGLGWTEAQARSFLEAHTALPEAQLDRELARILANPGEVLAYQLGEIELRRQRELATEALGEAFELEHFLGLVHHPGQSLPGLERDVQAWIRAQEAP